MQVARRWCRGLGAASISDVSARGAQARKQEPGAQCKEVVDWPRSRKCAAGINPQGVPNVSRHEVAVGAHPKWIRDGTPSLRARAV